MILADLLELWAGAWRAGLTMLGLGAVFSVILLVASEKLRVHIDPKIEQIHQALPGLDCGACGFAGCKSYARAVAEKPVLIGKCAPGGSATAEKIARLLNLQISGGGPALKPVVHCRAKAEDKTYIAKYLGIPSCTAANALPNGQACKFGCLGYGDCVRACKFDALHIIDGLAVVDYEKCTRCGACSQSCPRNLIAMVPFGSEEIITVACNNKENGRTTRKMCTVGCIGCGLCAKESQIFSLKDNLAGVNYSQYQFTDKEETALNKCPTKVIIRVGKAT